QRLRDRAADFLRRQRGVIPERLVDHVAQSGVSLHRRRRHRRRGGYGLVVLVEAECLLQRLEDLLGPQSYRTDRRRRGGVLSPWLQLALVRLRQRHGADPPLHVMARRDPVLREGVQHLRVPRRDAGAEVVDARIKAPAHQAGPDTIDVGPGKPRVLRAGQEAGEGLAAFLVGGVETDALAGQELRLHRDEPVGVLLVGHAVLAAGARLDGVGRAAALDVLVLHQLGPPEKGGELVELFALPRLRLGVVTLGALNLYAEEDAAGGSGHLDRVAVQGGQVVDRRRLVVDAGGGDQGADHLIPRPV